MQFVLYSFLSFTWAQSYFSCPGATDHSAPTTCVSGFSEVGRLTSALNQVQPDLRVVSLNQYAWRANDWQYSRIRDWLRSVLPSTDIIAFQEFSDGDFNSVNSFLTTTSFGGRRFQQLQTGNDNSHHLAIYATTDARFTNGGLEAYGWDNFNRNRGWADGYERYVTWGDIEIKGRTFKVANNHGCLGSFPSGQCSTLDRNCNSAGSNGKFPNGGCSDSGGRAIIEKLRTKGFFQNTGANSLFFCDCNNFSPPQLLCSEGMQVRGRLDCGGPDLDFIGYGSNFELLAHYGFGGTATGGDSDHKSVILDLKFRDSSTNPQPDPESRPEQPTCGNVPAQCRGHLTWALETGRNSIPESYPNFEMVTGRSLADATTADMQLYFYCENIQAGDCRDSGLQPTCCGDQPCSCEGSRPDENSSECSAGFINVKLQCGGCTVLTQSTSTHRTCSAFCAAQGRTCVSAFEEVNNNCDVLATYTCDTDFVDLGTSDALCECSSQPATAPPEDDFECTAGFTNVKMECGGCRVLTQDTTLHKTCNEYCGAQGRTCVSASEEVSNNCDVLAAHSCDTDFTGLGTSDALCECSSTPSSSDNENSSDPSHVEDDPNCPTLANANGLGFALSTGLMTTPLSEERVASIAKNTGVKKFRLYGWDNDDKMMAEILAQIPDATFAIEITPDQVNSCANNQNACLAVLQQYNPYSYAITYIAVGNEPLHAGKVTIFSNIAPALINTAAVVRSLGWNAKVTVPFSMSVLRDTYPVSDAYFVEPNSPNGRGCDSGCKRAPDGGQMENILSALRSAGGVFAIQAYPYFVANSEQSLLQPSLDATQVMHNQVAATKVAMEKLGFGSLPLIVTEVGWPTEGTAVANEENAQIFLSSLAMARKNPSTSFYNVDVFAFEFFDESRKGGAGDEPHFGWFTERGCKKFDIKSVETNSGNQVPVVPESCKNNVPASCQGHLDWAMSLGRYSGSASTFYPNFQSQTGVSLDQASVEDMQRYFVCNNLQRNDCASLSLPCGCSSPPCTCGGIPVAAFNQIEDGITSNESGDGKLPLGTIIWTCLAVVVVLTMAAIMYRKILTTRGKGESEIVKTKSEFELEL